MKYTIIIEGETTKMKIKYATDNTLSVFKKNVKSIFQFIQMNPKNKTWMKNVFSDEPFVERVHEIDDFKLKISSQNNYKDVEVDNAIQLFEHLKHLSMDVLTDERFWLWLYLEKFYEVTVQAMDLKSETTLLNHWTFEQGTRRGLFFGVLSRAFFRVYLTYDEKLEDPFLLSKYALENQERIRNLTWRSYSNIKHLVRGVMKGQMSIETHLQKSIDTKLFKVYSKELAKYGSVRLLDTLSERDFEMFTFNKYLELFNERIS